MKKVIVTGANGFVGQYLTKELVDRQYEVWAVVRKESEDLKCIKGVNVHIIFCDLEDILTLKNKISAKNFECFYHLAWAGSSGSARMNYELQLENAKACCDATVVASELKCKRFLGAGSITELMYGKYLRKDGSKPEMITCYAIAKMAAEYTSRCICTDKKIDFLWAHISNFYGVGDLSQNFINFLISNYSNKNTPILTSGEQKADFMYVSDVARALVVMSENGIGGNTYYVGYGSPKPLKEFVKIIHNSIAPEIESGVGLKDYRGMDVDFDSLDIGKLTRDTGFRPSISFEEGIKKVLTSLNKSKGWTCFED